MSAIIQSSTDLDDLFRRYHRELHRFAYGKLRDREVTSDIVQDAFLRYLAHDQGNNADTAPTTPKFFLWRIASNLIIDLVRRDRRRGVIAPIESIAQDMADPAPTAEHRLAARQEFLLLKAALDELPAKTRAALLLNRLEGLTHAEIAARLGISSSMVCKHIMRALCHCATRLEAVAG